MTAVTEILQHSKKLISEGNQIDTQGLVHWIEDTLLEMEKEQIRIAYMEGAFEKMRHLEGKEFMMPTEYYNETFKSE